LDCNNFPQNIWLSFKATLTRSSIKHIQFKNVSNQRKSEAQSHFLYNKAQQAPLCNLFSVIQELVQALKV